VGIQWLLHSSCCFLNTNTAITRQLIQTARTLEAEWWQVCAEAWLRGQTKISHVLGAFGLLDFTTLWPVLDWRAFWKLWTIYFFKFPNFIQAAVSRRYGGQPALQFLYVACSFHGLFKGSIWLEGLRKKLIGQLASIIYSTTGGV